MTEPIVYYGPGGSLFVPLGIALFGTGATMFLVLSLLGHGLWWFFLIMLIGGSWWTYSGLPASYRIAVVNDRLEWKSFLGEGTAPITDLVGVRYMHLGSLASFELSDGRHVRISVIQGYPSFIEALEHAYPDRSWNASGYARFVDRVRIGPRRGA